MHRGWARLRVMTRCVHPHASTCHTSRKSLQPWAFESREFLRALAVGKEISFVSMHSLPSNDDIQRDIGTVEIAGVDLASSLLRNGWVKLKEIKGEPTQDGVRRRELQIGAKAAGKGVWNPHGPQVRVICALSLYILVDALKALVVHHAMSPADLQAFVAEWKGKSLNGGSSRLRDVLMTQIYSV
jgi:staphylococcal nuclease domain-containing protein 1